MAVLEQNGDISRENTILVPQGYVGFVYNIQKIEKSAEYLGTWGLGTCVGLVVWDMYIGTAAVAHIDSDAVEKQTKLQRGDYALERVVDQILRLHRIFTQGEDASHLYPGEKVKIPDSVPKLTEKEADEAYTSRLAFAIVTGNALDKTSKQITTQLQKQLTCPALYQSTTESVAVRFRGKPIKQIGRIWQASKNAFQGVDPEKEYTYFDTFGLTIRELCVANDGKLVANKKYIPKVEPAVENKDATCLKKAWEDDWTSLRKKLGFVEKGNKVRDLKAYANKLSGNVEGIDVTVDRPQKRESYIVTLDNVRLHIDVASKVKIHASEDFSISMVAKLRKIGLANAAANIAKKVKV